MPVAQGLLDVSTPYPTPFGRETILRYSLGGAARVSVDVFDIRGRRVRTLAAGTYGPGSHVVTWDGCDDGGTGVASGLYFIRCATADESQVRRAVLLR